MSLKLKDMASWLGTLTSYCPIAGTALGTYSGAQWSVLVGALTIGFVAVNVVGVVLDLRKKGETAGSPVRAGFGYGLMVGAIVASVIWFYAP